MKKWQAIRADNKPYIDAVVAELKVRGATTFRGRTHAGEWCVSAYCTTEEFQASHTAARRAVAAAAQAAKAAAKPATARCAHYRLIRQFYAIARARGLDLKADGRIRAAMSSYFGFTIWSRADLTETHWQVACGGLESGSLSW